MIRSASKIGVKGIDEAAKGRYELFRCGEYGECTLPRLSPFPGGRRSTAAGASRARFRACSVRVPIFPVLPAKQGRNRDCR